jgi:protein involved in polysaccharide export with SLBB domain
MPLKRLIKAKRAANLAVARGVKSSGEFPFKARLRGIAALAKAKKSARI